mgnify:CR=1 FL=1
MKIRELFEGLSPVLFYARSVRSALDIFKSDEFRLSPTFTKGVEAHDKYNYYLSTSRSRTGKYHIDNSTYSVLIELDGRMLSNNLSGEPMDYWGADYRKYGGGAYEQEDRVYSNSDTIKNASKFVNKVDILIAPEGRDHQVQNKLVLDLVTTLKKRGIPVRLYKNNRDWITGSGNTISIEELLAYSRPEVKSISREQTDDEKFMNMRSTLRAKPKNDLGLIYKALVVDDFNMFTSEERYQLERYIRPMDARGQVSAELHNAQNHSSLRPTLVKIGEFMRKNGMRNAKDLADFLVDKWSTR